MNEYTFKKCAERNKLTLETKTWSTNLAYKSSSNPAKA
jgi:hypothetical protein